MHAHLHPRRHPHRHPSRRAADAAVGECCSPRLCLMTIDFEKQDCQECGSRQSLDLWMVGKGIGAGMTRQVAAGVGSGRSNHIVRKHLPPRMAGRTRTSKKKCGSRLLRCDEAPFGWGERVVVAAVLVKSGERVSMTDICEQVQHLAVLRCALRPVSTAPRRTVASSKSPDV